MSYLRAQSMREPARVLDHPPTMADLDALPPHIKGEIIDGVLYARPRPRGVHQDLVGLVHADLVAPFRRQRGGPGGWWILPEPGIELPGAPEVSPDLAGWRPVDTDATRGSSRPACWRMAAGLSSGCGATRPKRASRPSTRCRWTSRRGGWATLRTAGDGAGGRGETQRQRSNGARRPCGPAGESVSQLWPGRGRARRTLL